MPVLRHLLSVLLLPFVVVVLVPNWLLGSGVLDTAAWPQGIARVSRVAGALIFSAGFAVFVWCFILFARVGRGTLAPWDPTRHLIAVGPYRHVRNPMISAVAAMLMGEALFFGSSAVLTWCVVFILVNHVYFSVSEEPGLERRFGAEYLDYKRRVPRWLPRIGSSR